MTRRSGSLITNTPPTPSVSSASGIWPVAEASQNVGTGKWPYFFPIIPYTINNSLRLRSSASAYLNRTPSSASNRRTWTWSGWVKRSKLGVYQNLLDVFTSDSNWFTLSFNASNNIILYESITGVDYGYITSAVYRDTSAWYHIVCAVDTTQASASNRVKLYVNGVQTSFPQNYGDAPQNYEFKVNSTTSHKIGIYSDTSVYLDAYLAEINFVDGLALDPSYFGATNSTTGTWAPKAYTGSYGTNGYCLKFNNTASTTTLGYDSSSNSNNWTTNNISLTAGATYDAMLDSPAPVSATIGNYAVLNPLDKSSNISISDGNLAINCSTASHNLIRSSIALPSSGKFYAEMTFGNTMNGNPAAAFALLSGSASLSSHPVAAGNYCVYGSVNTTLNSGATGGAAVTGMTTGQVWQFAVDVDGGNAWIGLNNSWFNVYSSGSTTGNPSTGANPTFSGGSFAGLFFGADLVNASATINLGQRPFAYTPPTGFKALQTYNLPAPSIVDGSKYMAATLYTGTGASQSVVNSSGFQPDFVWIKGRSSANQDHTLVDSVRGISRRIRSNTTGVEILETGFNVTSFNSTGFTVSDDSAGSYNVNGAVGGTYSGAAQYVGWQWKAGGTAVTNTAGSITSSASASTSAGFSVVTYTGTGSSATVGHGLGVAPSMIIIKSRSSGSSNWQVYHSAVVSLANGKQWLALNTTDSLQTNGSATTFTSASSTTFGIGDSSALNASSGTFVAYCFASIAGYSAFGSYAGDNSSDGPFVYCGFRPRFILRKGTVTAGVNWSIIDTSRNTYNVSSANLYPNLSDAEGSSGDIDITSNGFKMRSSSFNASGETYIYAAFAENPFQYSLAR